MKTLIPYLFGFDYSENSDAVFEAVRNRYFGDKPFNQSFQGFAKVYSHEKVLEAQGVNETRHIIIYIHII